MILNAAYDDMKVVLAELYAVDVLAVAQLVVGLDALEIEIVADMVVVEMEEVVLTVAEFEVIAELDESDTLIVG